ncbi:MAG TPA: hypothetical protein VEV44_18465, partial [Pseudoneobacillus sp.]|nr:hypothetical protein [Pseudoneobacillus sp.]
TLKIVFWVFSIFSVIFFLSHGLVERILIPARNDSFEMLVNSGRGARTLSPEPSFFALHVFNLYIIFYLLATKESILKYGNIIFLLASFCLMISLSGYGFVIFLLIFFMRYTKISLTMAFLLILSSGVLISYLDSLQNFRGIRLLTTVLVENPMVLLNDASFLSRFGSFIAYLQNIKENYIIGDGFTLLQGGGFISIVSSLGIIAALFLIYILFEIFTLKKSGFKIKIILIFWFLINLFSGPIGIPTLGVIIGLILRKNHTGSGFNKFQNLVNA